MIAFSSFSFFFILHIPTVFAVGIAPSLTFLIKPELKPLHHSLLFLSSCLHPSIHLDVGLSSRLSSVTMSLSMAPGCSPLASHITAILRVCLRADRCCIHPPLLPPPQMEPSAVSSSFAVRCGQKTKQGGKKKKINNQKNLILALLNLTHLHLHLFTS